MRVFELQQKSDEYANLTLASEEDRERLSKGFKGQSMRSIWSPVRVQMVKGSTHESDRPLGDFPALGIHPVFSERAVTALRDFLDLNGELLQLLFGNESLFAYNITTITDVLDEEKSRIQRFATGQVMRVEQYAFHSNRLENLTIFKIPQHVASRMYVTDLFVERVEQCKLEGFDFLPLWPATPDRTKVSPQAIPGRTKVSD